MYISLCTCTLYLCKINININAPDLAKRLISPDVPLYDVVSQKKGERETGYRKKRKKNLHLNNKSIIKVNSLVTKKTFVVGSFFFQEKNLRSGDSPVSLKSRRNN